jgi:hypothetical protein
VLNKIHFGRIESQSKFLFSTNVPDPGDYATYPDHQKSSKKIMEPDPDLDSVPGTGSGTNLYWAATSARTRQPFKIPKKDITSILETILLGDLS